MAKCAICGKGAHFGNAVSHSHRRSNKMHPFVTMPFLKHVLP